MTSLSIVSSSCSSIPFIGAAAERVVPIRVPIVRASLGDPQLRAQPDNVSIMVFSSWGSVSGEGKEPGPGVLDVRICCGG